MAVGQPAQQYGGQPPKAVAAGTGTPPDSQTVDAFHANDDLDVRRESHHHSLGPFAMQASPGNHTHDGGLSALLLDGTTVTGSRADGTALLSAIQALVRLGAKDNTTA